MDFLSFCLNRWEDPWQSRHQVMSRLAKDHKVLFVSPPFEIRQVISNLRARHLPKSGLIHRETNLYTLVPSKGHFENYRFPRVEQMMAYLRQVEVLRTVEKLGFKDLVLFIWHPRYWNLLGKFGESVSCYYVDEEFTGYYDMSEESKQRTRLQEDFLLKNADLVFANGTALAEKKSQFQSAINVPMGVDFHLFSKARLEETPVPADLEAIPRPRVGYIGAVNEKVDFQLLDEIAKTHPDWSIVIVGHVTVRIPEFCVGLERLKSCPNVFFLGLKPKEMLPNYVKGLDVCLMCFRTDGWAYWGYPLKLHEYLAGGKPVVSSDLPSIREWSPLIAIARRPEEWTGAIQQALNDQDPEEETRRVEVARRNTWEERVHRIEEAIEKKMIANRRRSPSELDGHDRS